MYGDSEDLLGKWFAANPEKRQDIFLATKFGIGLEGGKNHTVDSSAEYCRQAIERSLKRLGLPSVDLYYIHRLDKVTPIEKTIQVMADLKLEGKIGHIGLSECSADSLRRAHAVHPITCVQMEYSPFALDIESPQYRLLDTARELGVAVVAYSPLGKGLLGGAIRNREDFTKPGDMRPMLPWFAEENLAKNTAVVDRIAGIAASKGITTAQATLAWILAQGDDIFAIPGTTKIHRLEENLGSLDVVLTPEEETSIRKVAVDVVGARMPDFARPNCFSDTPAL